MTKLKVTLNKKCVCNYLNSFKQDKYALYALYVYPPLNKVLLLHFR